MVKRSTVDFTEQIAPIFRKYANTYGVKNTCSLGAILINELSPNQREKLMSMVAEDVPLDEIETHLAREHASLVQTSIKMAKTQKKRIYKK